MRRAVITLTASCLVLASCQTRAESQSAAQSASSSSQPDGAYLAQALCSGCHAVAAGEISPNPESPDFVSIANRAGLTRETLGNFLHDSYSFPNQMNLELSDDDADAIAAYILTLREE